MKCPVIGTKSVQIYANRFTVSAQHRNCNAVPNKLLRKFTLEKPYANVADYVMQMF